jgi:hypothetical protein
MPTTIKISTLRNHAEKGVARITYQPNLFGDQEQILGDSSITVDNQSRDFSFKNSLSETEDLQNPNILNQDNFAKVKNKDLLLKDKFDTQDDPIFDLDEAPSMVTKREPNQTSKTKSSAVNKKLRALKTNPAKKRY